MFRNKRLLWAAVFLAGCFAPKVAYAVEEDPYIYKSLVGRVYFEFEKASTEQNGVSSDSSRFQQTYSLDLKGNIVSRRLVIYDAGFAFTDNNYTSTSSDINTDTKDYYLRTTILPKSGIPLTLYGTHAESSTSSSDSITTKTTYGLNWFLKLRTLPQTSIYAERALTESSSVESETGNYKVIMKKALGPTQNELTSTYSTSDSSDGTNSSQNTINYSNTTKVSRSTQLYLGATRSNSESDDTDTSLEGLTLTLNSKPSTDFTQNHHYTFYRTKIDSDTQIGKNYSADMLYRLNDRADANAGLNLSTADNESSSSSSETATTGANAGVNYRVTSNLSTSGAVSYSDYKTNSTDSSTTTGDRKTFRVTSRATYNKTLSWALLGAGYSLGYVEDKAQDLPAGKGLEQTVNGSLSNIDVNRFVGFAVAYSRGEVKTFSGENIDTTTKTYSASAFNKELKKYILMNASYQKYSLDSYLDSTDSKTETYRLDATSTYFKNVSLQSYAERSNTFTTQSGFGQSDSAGVSASHGRAVLKGNLSLSVFYSVTDSEFEGGSELVKDAQYLASYSRKFNNLSWQSTLQMTEKRGSSTKKDALLFQNSLLYPLRSWLVALEQKYSLTNDNNTETKENSILFKATRVFVRIW
ncbi:MAG: hypothetical protein HY954_00620 [Deltaproteobacteria bacterium]|nr:hypothetical protein [Deltaproteobacteria bacterium]